MQITVNCRRACGRAASISGRISPIRWEYNKPIANNPYPDEVVEASDALNEGRIAGAAVDVFDKEPPLGEDEPLLRAKNCLLTPHVAFLSEEAMIRRAHIAFNNTLAYLDGKPENVCTLI